MGSLIDPKIKLYQDGTSTFSPDDNSIVLYDGTRLHYSQLVVTPGIKLNIGATKGLTEALADPSALVASIYSYDYCDKIFRIIENSRRGRAIFTQPAGTLKCAGAPQKSMWLALDK